MAENREVDIKLIVDDKGAIQSIQGFDQKIQSTIADAKKLESELTKTFINNKGSKELGKDIVKLQQEFIKAGGSVDTFAKSFLNAKQSAKEVEKVEKELQKLNGELEKTGAKGKAGFDQLTQSSGLAKQAIGTALGVVTGQAISLATQKLYEYANVFQKLRDIAPIEAQRNAFEALSNKIGVDATFALNQYREATKGYVKDADLVAIANQAVLLGVNTNSGAFAKLTADAVKLGDAMGISVKESVESLTLGIGRQSKLILDNLGIIVDIETAYKNYAEANKIVNRELTDSEKKLAFQAEAMRKISNAAKDLPPVMDTAADAVQRLDASTANLTDQFLLNLSKNENLRDSLNDLATAIDGVDTSEFAKNLGDLAALVIRLGSVIVEYGVPAFNFLSDITKNTATNLGIVADAAIMTNGNLLTLGTALPKAFDAKVTEIATEKVNEYYKATNKVFTAIIAGSQKTSAELTGASASALKKAITDFENVQEKFGVNKSKVLPHLEKLKSTLSEYDKTLAKNKQTTDQSTESDKKRDKELEKQEKKLESLYSLIGDIAGASGSIDDLASSFSKVFDNRYVKTAQTLETELRQVADNLIKSGIPADKVAQALKEAERNAEKLRKNLDDTKKVFGELSLDKQIQTIGKDLGIELSDGISQGLSAGADVIFDGLQNGFNRDSLKDLGGSVGSALGAYIGGPLGAKIGEIAGEKYGEAIAKIGQSRNKTLEGLGTLLTGSMFGDQVGKALVKAFGKNDPDANARHAFQAWFNKLIEKSEIDFSQIGFLKGGFQLPNGRNAFDQIINDAGEATTAVNEELKKLNIAPETLASFQGLGTALGVISGTSLDGIIGQFGQLLAVNFKNAEGLNELQLLLQSTGMSSEEMGKALENAFLKGQISAGEYLQGLNAVNEVMTKGVPSAIGAINIAFNNLVNKGLKDGLHGMDALGDLAVEAGELGIKSLDGLKDALIAQGVPAQQANQLFSQLGASGIKTLEQLKNITAQSTASVIAGLDSQKTFFAEQSKNIDELAKKLDQIQNKEVEVKVNFKGSFSDDATRQAVTNSFGSNGIGAGGA